MKAAMKKLKGPLGLSLLAAALTAAALAAVSVAQDDGKAEDQKGGTERADRPGPPMLEELSAEDREAMERFRSCMEDNGAPAPPAPPEPGEGDDGNGDGADVFEHRIDPPSEEERAKIEQALEACSDELPEGVRHFGPGGPGGPCGPPPGVRPGDGEGSGS
jgi:hypothetical protein